MEQTLSSRLNFSDYQHDSAVKINKRKDVNYYETLCCYCADNSIDLKNIKDTDFTSAAMILESYAQNDLSCDYYYFWIDGSKKQKGLDNNDTN
jgi:hypothetical protein